MVFDDAVRFAAHVTGGGFYCGECKCDFLKDCHVGKYRIEWGRVVFLRVIIYIQDMADKYKIPYVNMCIRLFAKRFRLSLQAAASYLCDFKGVRFLDECYSSEHLLPVEDALNDLVVVCKNNGGTIG